MTRQFIRIISGLFFCLSLYAQDNIFDNTATTDSSIRFKGIVKPLEIDYYFDELFIPFNSNNELSYNSQSTIWLTTELAINRNMFNAGDDFHQHFLLPLYTQYLEDSEFDMFRYALGMVQLSAVSYMAYRHVKKYGFFK